MINLCYWLFTVTHLDHEESIFKIALILKYRHFLQHKVGKPTYTRKEKQGIEFTLT